MDLAEKVVFLTKWPPSQERVRFLVSVAVEAGEPLRLLATPKVCCGDIEPVVFALDDDLSDAYAKLDKAAAASKAASDANHAQLSGVLGSVGEALTKKAASMRAASGQAASVEEPEPAQPC